MSATKGIAGGDVADGAERAGIGKASRLQRPAGKPRVFPQMQGLA